MPFTNCNPFLSIANSDLHSHWNMAGPPMIECLVMASAVLSFLLLSTICAGHTTHYIKPTPSTPCPVDPCLTLSDYAQQCLHNLTSNTTLLLLPGDHVLSVNFTVENVSGFEILSPADGHQTRILCQGLVGFSFSNISHVTMHGLRIKSCTKGTAMFSFPTEYGLLVHSVSDTSISNCSFQDSAGTALGVFNTRLDLRGSNYFTSNRRCREYTKSCSSNGGGIYASMSTLKFTGNSTFRANSATFGGGIYAMASTFISFNGNTIFGNNSAIYGGGIITRNSTLDFNGSSTFGNNSATEYGGGIYAVNSLVTFNGNSFFRNNSAGHGGGAYVQTSTVIFSGSSTFENNSATSFGGGIDALQNALIDCNGNSLFRNNAAEYGGGTHARNSTLKFSGSSTFGKNSAERYGGGITVHSTLMYFNGNSIFMNNLAEYGGGILALKNTVIIFFGDSIFKNNSAEYGGGILAQSSTLNFSGSSTFAINSATRYGGGIDASYNTVMNFNGNGIFRNNSAEYGGGIDASYTFMNFIGNSNFENNYAAVAGGGIFTFQHSILSFTGNINFTHNSAVAGGGMSLMYGTTKFTGNSIITNNSASSEGGGIYLLYSTLNLTGNSTFRKNSAGIGGGIYVEVSTLSITGNSSDNVRERNEGGKVYTSMFRKNLAMIHGGAIYTDGSIINFHGHNIISSNSAQYSAGGIYSKNSNFTFSGSTNFRSNSGQLLGGGIYALGTLLYFIGNSSFTANTAARGGGEYLVNSFNFLSQNASITMDSNNATEYGGAVYVEDSDPISHCFPESINLERCLFQVNGLFRTSLDDMNQLLPIFWDAAAVHEFLESNESTARAIRAFLNISIHFCNNHAQKAGSAVYGGSIDSCIMELAYTLHIEHTISVQGFFRFNWHIPNLELNQNSITSDPFQVCLCKNGVLDCSTSESDRQMQVYPGQLLKLPVVATGQRDGIVPAVVRAFFTDVHRNASLLQFQDTQNVLNNCTELYYQVYSSAANNSGTLVLYADGPCSTNGKLLNISLDFLDCPHGFSLNPSEGTCECEPRLQEYTTRCNITDRTLERSGDFWVGYDNHTRGLILHPHCPFDYCISGHINVSLNDTDKQCDNNRSGLLCGDCKSSFSLALGSSKCLQCSNIYILLLIPFSLAGIALVFLLLIFKLTVAAGTINGLIFYANIVAANHSIFFPHNETNILTIFINWLNLDLGIETCFFDGMDAYVKTWLQFVFPLYVWSLVGLIIITSEYSSSITRVFGSNPVAVLATLFLLSYAKLLRTIIAALYFTFMDYPDQVRVAVWKYDGNILYIHGKHIPLFLVALLTFLVLFLPYTFLLTVGQWLQAKSNRRFFYWINNPKIKPFLDAYQAPYKDQHRYWTGLMLCLRCVLFLAFVLLSLVSADPSHNLLAIQAVVIGLVTLTRFTGLIYKKLYLDVLEASFILNLGILAAATYSVRIAETSESQAAVTYVSVGIAFATFVGVLVYHAYQQVWPKLQQRIHQLHHRHEHQYESVDEADVDNREQIPTAPTMTIIERPSPEPLELPALITFTELREPLNLIDTGDH